MMNRAIEDWSDERRVGNGIIVTLNWGWSFDPNIHEGVRGFDTVREAKTATRIKGLYRCQCYDCRERVD